MTASICMFYLWGRNAPDCRKLSRVGNAANNFSASLAPGILLRLNFYYASICNTVIGVRREGGKRGFCPPLAGQGRSKIVCFYTFLRKIVSVLLCFRQKVGSCTHGKFLSSPGKRSAVAHEYNNKSSMLWYVSLNWHTSFAIVVQGLHHFQFPSNIESINKGMYLTNISCFLAFSLKIVQC